MCVLDISVRTERILKYDWLLKIGLRLRLVIRAVHWRNQSEGGLATQLIVSTYLAL
jgi:hypothetical protein